MKVYLSVPMIANRALERALLMAKAIRDSGHEVTSPWVLGPIENLDPKSVNVFRRDLEGAEKCDAIVADVTVPSIGVGMEIMAAYKAGKRIILLEKRGSVTSRMLSHMEGKEVVEFEKEEDVYEGILGLLRGGAGG